MASVDRLRMKSLRQFVTNQNLLRPPFCALPPEKPLMPSICAHIDEYTYIHSTVRTQNHNHESVGLNVGRRYLTLLCGLTTVCNMHVHTRALTYTHAHPHMHKCCNNKYNWEHLAPWNPASLIYQSTPVSCHAGALILTGMHGTPTPSSLHPSYPMQKETGGQQKFSFLPCSCLGIYCPHLIHSSPRHARPAPQRIHHLLCRTQ